MSTVYVAVFWLGIVSVEEIIVCGVLSQFSLYPGVSLSAYLCRQSRQSKNLEKVESVLCGEPPLNGLVARGCDGVVGGRSKWDRNRLVLRSPFRPSCLYVDLRSPFRLSKILNLSLLNYQYQYHPRKEP